MGHVARSTEPLTAAQVTVLRKIKAARNGITLTGEEERIGQSLLTPNRCPALASHPGFYCISNAGLKALRALDGRAKEVDSRPGER